MLRASKLYSNGAIRSNLLSNQRISQVVFKRCESTVSTSEKKKSGSVLGKILGATILVGSVYGGASYYALNDKEFRDTFTTYVPGAQQTLEFVEDMQKMQDLDSYRDQASDWKKQAEEYTESAKSFGTKIQESATDAVDYATEAFQQLTGQKESPKPFEKAKSVSEVNLITTTKNINQKTPTDTTTTASLTTGNSQAPAIVAVAIEKPEPILVKSIQSNNAVVRELSQIVYELASILNDSGLSGLGREIIKEAEEKIEKINQGFVRLDNEQAAILESLKELGSKGEKIEGSLEKFHVEAGQAIEQAHIRTAEQIIAREAQLKNQFEQTRAEMKTSFAQQLAADLNAQAERLEQARVNALAAQAQELQNSFVKQVKLLVEQERAGRLAKLDDISKRFKSLEKYSVKNAEALDRSRQNHVIHVTLDAFQDTLQAPHKQSFADELQALSFNTKQDKVIQTVLNVIPKEIAQEGVNSISELSVRFEQVADEVRQVALVPEDGGFGSHIISIIMSYLMFKKAGLIQGDDVESILSRTGYYLKRDNLEFAARELNQLNGWPKRLAQDWIESARRHLEVKQALEASDKLKKDVEERLKGGVTFIVLGASGDLAKKKTFPALFALFQNSFLPRNTTIVGYARTKMDSAAFYSRIEPYLKPKQDDPKKSVQEFLKMCHYVPGQYDDGKCWEDLNHYVSDLEAKHGLKDEQKNRIFYMALPPSVFVSVADGLRKHVYSKTASTSIIIEKPFGKDLESCRALLQDIQKLYKEDEVYRIDHYLGKELAKNIMTVRFANMIFSPLWSRMHIDSVQITMKEPFGTEGRGGYFDEFGIIRDVMQNHLLQLMSLVAMERPVGRDSESIRDEKVKVLKCVKPIELKDTLLGQFVKSGDKPGYLDDDTVPKGSLCPTFAAIVLWIDNERWADVPFILKAGKALDNGKVDIRIQFKKLHGNLFEGVARNELVFHVQPGEAIYMKFNNKCPGFSDDSMITELDLTYRTRYKNLKVPEAYESLVLDALRGDHSNFVRNDELIASWKIFTPLLHQIEKEKIKPEPYLYGSRGPKQLNGFVRSYGVERLAHENYQWPLQNLPDE
ncbi:glucose-6-phosphate dehydrogenase [Helicostylum pulchrum]|nr:glucose-6-phosphate dehydrogenase [Helicostylum pulchrum]